MGKVKNAEVLSLDKTKQKDVVKQTKQISKNVKEGKIRIKNNKKARKLSVEQSRGLLFVSHLPHGFYEDELKNYFKQFGKVTNVKVCRSSRSGRSKGYAYVEFVHPDVAKIAGDTMNNYLMFKKRLTAEYIPFEKRPKGLFIGKQTTLERFSSKVRRQKQRQINSKMDEATHQKRTRARLTRLNKHLERLNSLGVKTTFRPESIAVIQEDNSESSSEQVSLNNENESVNEDIGSTRKSKSISRVPSVKSLPDTTTTRASKLVKSKSLTAISSSNNDKSDDNSSTSKNKDVVKKKNKKKSALTKNGGIKKNKKLAPLNTDTVKKIARELIRKRGDSLLSFAGNVKDKTKKKNKK